MDGCPHHKRTNPTAKTDKQASPRPSAHAARSMAAPASTQSSSGSSGGSGGSGGACDMDVEVLEGDLVKAPLQRKAGHFVVHQANCVSKGARGLAKALFDVVPDVRACVRGPKWGLTSSLNLCHGT